MGLLDAEGAVLPLPGVETVAAALADRPAAPAGEALPHGAYELEPPIDSHEVWAAGVTYRRSRSARMAESETSASLYDRVYDAERPELFFKATPSRVAAPGAAVSIRSDSSWSVPEPELALWLTPELELAGVGLGNDMSARDIEGDNALYLPQAKVYARACALGPGVLPCHDWDLPLSLTIRLAVRREGALVFEDEAPVDRLHRDLRELVGWLGRDNVFPHGVVLLTGTGIVPPDSFALREGDEVAIASDGLGSLESTVRQGVAA